MKVVVISSSLRAGSNSEALALEFGRGAEDAGHAVTFISLRGMNLGFCRGCLSCQKTGGCIIDDDAAAIADAVLEADVVALATPVYYYGMSGQLKTLLDRLNPLYPKDYRFRRVFVLTAAAEDDPHVPERTVEGIRGWTDCFEKAELAGHVFAGGVTGPGETDGHPALKAARDMGRGL